MTDYPDREHLLALDLDPAIVERLLRDTLHSGHGGRLVIPADQLVDLLGLLEREEGRLP